MAANTRPLLVFVAGPNGAGKTTIATPGPGGLLHTFGLDPSLRLNADEETRRLIAFGAPDAPATNLEAARRTDEALANAIDAGRSVLVETVLSSDKYRPLLERARERGFDIALVYVCLRRPDISAGRIRQRVREGGHDVPADRLEPRWRKSLLNLVWFGARADAVYILDNSGGGDGPILLTSLSADEAFLDTPAIDALPLALRDAIHAMCAARAG